MNEDKVKPFRITEYVEAENAFMGSVIQGMISLDPLLGDIRSFPSVHQGPTRNVREPEVLDQVATSISHGIKVEHEVIHNTYIEDFISELCSMAVMFRDSQAKLLFQNLGAAIDVVGNTIDAKGARLSPDTIIDLMDKVKIDFDPNGNPIFPTLVISPDVGEKLHSLTFSTDQNDRLGQVLKGKKAEFYAKKRTRRLS